MSRKLVVAGAALLVAGLAALVLLRAQDPPSSGAISPTAPTAPGAAGATGDDREVARRKLLAMKQALDNAPRPRRVVLSGAERRPGESPALFEERQRAIAEFNHFARDSNLAPEQVDAVARIITDAQDTWRLGLESAHRVQPEAPGAEMSDPVLSQLIVSITEEAQRAAREVVPTPAAAIVQSYFPTMLPYVRTRVFETPR